MLNVVLFVDGRPGHEKQSRGILRALNQYIELEIHEVRVGQSGFLRNLTDHILYFLRPFKPLPDNDRTDLIIGTGSRTHIQILSWKKRYGGLAITCMSPVSFIRGHFDLCFVPIHDRLPQKANILETIGPPNISTNTNDHDSTKSMILIGGEDKHSHQWDGDTLVRDIKRLVGIDASQKWTLSSSPRTPDETDVLLRSFVDENKNVDYLPFADTEPGWIEEQYRTNKSVWVTGDSISMVYEALSAGCSVGIIPVKWNKNVNKFRYSLDYLVRNERVITLEQYLNGEQLIIDAPALNEADRCAQEIVKRWWPENSQ